MNEKLEKLKRDLGIEIEIEPAPPRPGKLNEPNRSQLPPGEILAGKYDFLFSIYGPPWRRGEKARLARAAGVSRQYITELTSGRRKATPQMAKRLSQAAERIGLRHLPLQSFMGERSPFNVKFGDLNRRWQMLQKQELLLQKKIFLPTQQESIQIGIEMLTNYRKAVQNPQSAICRYVKRLNRLLTQQRRAALQELDQGSGKKRKTTVEPVNSSADSPAFP